MHIETIPFSAVKDGEIFAYPLVDWTTGKRPKLFQKWRGRAMPFRKFRQVRDETQIHTLGADKPGLELESDVQVLPLCMESE